MNIENMSINEIAQKCFDQAKELGWQDREIPIPEQIALIHSEASEALESFRNNEPTSWVDAHGKPQGIASEFADIIIRVGHYAVLNNIDLAYEIERKLKYNMTRGHRHGGKAA